MDFSFVNELSEEFHVIDENSVEGLMENNIFCIKSVSTIQNETCSLGKAFHCSKQHMFHS